MTNPCKAFMDNLGPTHEGPCEFHQDFSGRYADEMMCIQDGCMETILVSEFLELWPKVRPVVRR